MADKTLIGDTKMSTASLEQRVALLEAEVARIRNSEIERRTIECTPWWEKRFGAFKDDPGYDDVVRLGAEYRKLQPIATDDDLSA